MSNKKSILIVAAALACVFTSGCTQIRNYSVRSYQGPMPLSEYQHMVDLSQHSVPAPQPVATTTAEAITSPTP